MLTSKCQIHLSTYSVLIYFVQINLYEIAAVGILFTINILPRLILLLLEHYLLSTFTSSNPAAVGTLFTLNICLV